MNVLGSIFNAKLSWATQVTLTIRKVNKATNAIRLTRKHFNTKQLIQIITSNFFSILYYKSEVWRFLFSYLHHPLMLPSVSGAG
jgi:hypothetical protein